MPEHPRPDPDRLLTAVRADAQRQGRGRLRVFLGYAAGVGKTYAMLQAAHERRSQGVDVIVGVVETHGRRETEALLTDLETVPLVRVDYRGVALHEMDLDAIVARHPRVVLVDEMAHTNAPGSRHEKRYQDIEELLQSGIDVYTTLNVQHLESFNDVVAQVTGVVVRETVPDSTVDEADGIELVDLPTDELLRRLGEGKVYAEGQAELAAAGFFRAGNLSALREMVLRRAAQRVDAQMRAYMRISSIPGPWPANERLAVCVSPSPTSERLIRSARRMADELRADWYAVYVETPGHTALSESGHASLSRNLRLAEGLGARTASVAGPAVAETIVRFARDHNVTKLVVGKSVLPRWLQSVRGSLADEITRASGDIDVVCIGDSTNRRPRKTNLGSWVAASPARDYLKASGLVAAAAAACWPALGRLEPTNLVMVFFAAVLIAAVRLGRGPSMLAALLSVALFDFAFVEPRLTMAVSDAQYLITFAGFLVVGLVTSHLAARLKEQTDNAQRRERLSSALYALSRDLAAATSLDRVVEAVLYHTGYQIGQRAAVLLADGPALKVAGASPTLALDDNALGIAQWAFDHGQEAGHGTHTLASAPARFVPLRTAGGTVGVLAVQASADGLAYLPPQQQEQLLVAFSSLTALGIERILLAEQANHLKVLEEGERLQEALLHSISHDLRTPLAAITGVLSGLRDEALPGAKPLEMPARAELIETGWQEAERLNRLVGNLLDIARLETGAFRVDPRPCDVQDLVGSVLGRLEQSLVSRHVRVSIPDDTPPVRADFVLIVQALTNIVENALKYSPAGSPLSVTATAQGATVELAVADSGTGIDAADMPHVFAKFYRGQSAREGTGTGLGLAIAKGFVEAHGGGLTAEAGQSGGTVLRMVLPAAEAEHEVPQ